MNYNQVQFIGAYGTSKQIPTSIQPEVSFVGRSNVGKSSLINRLFNRKKLAKVSQRPGKTSTVNFFRTDGIDFVDLPGYGYAQVSKSEKARWDELINGYFDQYRYYALVVSLVDIRHPATKLDEQMIGFLQACELPFCIALTKADKLSRSAAARQEAAIRAQLALPDTVPFVVTSAEKGTGFDALKRVIKEACA